MCQVGVEGPGSFLLLVGRGSSEVYVSTNSDLGSIFVQYRRPKYGCEEV